MAWANRIARNIFTRELDNNGYKQRLGPQSQDEDNFPTFSLGLEFLNEVEKEKKRKTTENFTVRGWSATKFDRKQSGKNEQMTNWSVSAFKDKLKFFRVKLLNIKLELSTGNLK